MITIKDIAKKAGVSHGTVSNVLNKTGKVSVEKIKLVESAAEKLGYIRNTQAQQLRQGFKKLVVVIIPNLQIINYSELFTTLRDKLISFDYDVDIYTTKDIPILEKKLLEEINLSRLDAIVTVSSLSDEVSSYKNACPIIFVDRKPSSNNLNSCFISFDYKLAGTEIGKYILKENCKNVAFFSNSIRFLNNKLIFQGLEEVLTNNNISMQRFSSDYNLATNKAFDIFNEEEIFDVIVTTNIERAEAILSAYNFSDCSSIPKIITIDFSKTFPNNHFVTYELNYKLMGQTIGDELIDYLINNKPIKKEIILKNDGFRFKFPYLNTRKKSSSLNILTLISPSSISLQKLLPNFEKITGIKVNVTTLSFNDLYEHIAMLEDSDIYDLIRMDVAWTSELSPNIYLPLNDTGKDFSSIFSKIIDDIKNDYSALDNIKYTVPFDPSILVFLYRKDLFDDAMIKRHYYEMFHETLTVPNDFNQYNKIASFFTKSLNSYSPTEYGSTLTYGTSAVAACDFLPRLLSNQNNFFDDGGRIIIDTPEVLCALKNYIETYKYSSKKNESWWKDSIREFASGSTAMTIAFSNHTSDVINSKYSNIVGNVGFSTIPGNNPILGGGVIGISKNSNKINECYEFFKWLYSSEISSAFTLLGGLSPCRDSYENCNILNIFTWLSECKNSFSKGTRKLSNCHHTKFDQRKFENILGNAVKSSLTGTHSPKEALEHAQKLFDIHFKPNK